MYAHVVNKSTADKLCVKVGGVSTRQEADEWLAGYSQKTKTTWRSRRKQEPVAKVVLYMVSCWGMEHEYNTLSYN